MSFIRLNKLQQLAESTEVRASSRAKQKIENQLHDFTNVIDRLDDDIDEMRKFMTSPVMVDFLKLEGFPATETKAATAAINAVYSALRDLEAQMADLTMAVSMHNHYGEDPELGDQP